MKKLIKLGLIIAGAAVLTFTMASATADSEAETMKSGKSMKCNGGEDKKKETNTTKPAPEKGKCGTGKCG